MRNLPVWLLLLSIALVAGCGSAESVAVSPVAESPADASEIKATPPYDMHRFDSQESKIFRMSSEHGGKTGWTTDVDIDGKQYEAKWELTDSHNVPRGFPNHLSVEPGVQLTESMTRELISKAFAVEKTTPTDDLDSVLEFVSETFPKTGERIIDGWKVRFGVNQYDVEGELKGGFMLTFRTDPYSTDRESTSNMEE